MRWISLVFLLACSKPPAPEVARDAALPDAAPKPPVPQAVPVVKGLGEAMAAAADCVTEGRPRRGCLGYDRLRDAVRIHRGDTDWVDELLRHAAGPADADRTRLALTLLADGALEGPSDRLLPVLLPLADATVPFVRAQAVRALAIFDGPGVVEKALALVEQDPDPEVRESAAFLLGRPQQTRDTKESVAALLRVLAKETDPSVKRAAIGALGQFKSAAALPTFISLMDDPLLGPNVTLEIGGYPQSEALKAILDRIALTKTGKELPPATLAALGRLRDHPEYDPVAVKALLEAVLPFADKDGSPTGRISLEMLKNHLEGLKAAPVVAPATVTP